MKISEIFYSIQGEGKYTGAPSVFIRTSYCNLRCGWCDTPYTSHKPENKDMSIDEITEQFKGLGSKRYFVPHVVLTGGEPFIQNKECVELTYRLRDLNPSVQITIETNGTIFAPVFATLISISPKLKSSAPYENQTTKALEKAHETIRTKLKIKEFRQKYDCQFKFVITKLEDLDEVLGIVDVHNIPQHEVYLMPEGITREDLSFKAEKTAQMCLEHGFNYSDRLHVRIWNDARGV